MPDPISLSNAQVSGSYDLEAGVCVAAPPAASPAAALAPAPTGAGERSTLDAGAQQLINGYTQPTPAKNCELEAAKAAIVCGQAVLTTLASAPTVVVPVVTALVGGIACGIAGAEAYVCYSNRL
jgi:hypothetical protein